MYLRLGIRPHSSIILHVPERKSGPPLVVNESACFKAPLGLTFSHIGVTLFDTASTAGLRARRAE